MKPARGLRFLVATAALVLALVAVGCTTVENVTIRERSLEGSGSALTYIGQVFGEVNNHTAGYVGQVQVKGSLFDAGGTVVDSPYFRVCPTMVKPHDTIPFATSYSFTGTSPIATYELHVEKSIPIAPVPDASLSISGVSVERDEHDTVHVLGMVTNTGSERYEEITVCAAFYDSSGKVDGLLIGYGPDVDPGQTASFDAVSLFGFGSEPSSGDVSYRLWVAPGRIASGGYMDLGYVSTDKLPLR